jgi:hypothetical protein
MSSIRTLNPGESTVFTTRILGQPPTRLYFGPVIDPAAPLPTISWRKILCCESDHVENRPGPPVVIPTAGELITVTNISSPNVGARVWTDYL